MGFLGRLIRWSANGLAAAMLLASILMVIFWIHSHWRWDSLELNSPRGYFDVDAVMGRFEIVVALEHTETAVRWEAQATPLEEFAGDQNWTYFHVGLEPDSDDEYNCLGFRWSHINDIFLIAIPFSYLLAIAMSYLVWWTRRLRKSRRTHRTGYCRKCGYDLRASPGRCPECGTVAASVAAQSL